AKQCSRGEPPERGTTISDYSTGIGAPEIAGNCVAAANDSQCLTPFRPIQMPVQKSKRALPVDRMSAIEVFDFGFVRQAELRIKPAYFGVLVGYPLVFCDSVIMAAFNHERPRQHQVSHLG